jgi:hypothetical protein
MSKLQITILLITGIVISFIVLVFLTVSPLTKYLIQKYDAEFTGREITLDGAYVNPFTGYIFLSNVKISELNNKGVFFSAKGISADFAMLKLFFKTFEINELSLDEPRGLIIQNKLKFNFDDLVERFTGDSDPTKDPVHFNLLNISIKKGKVFYIDEVTPIKYFISNVNIRSPGIWWNNDTINAAFSFNPGIGNGAANGDFTMEIKKLDYQMEIKADNYDLNFIGQYLNDITNYGTFSAGLDAALKVAGNFNNKLNITACGFLGINDFHFGKTTGDDYASFDKLSVSIIEMSPADRIFFYDSIVFQNPFFKFERYEHYDNIQKMFGVNGENIDFTIADEAKFNLVIEIGNYIKLISRNFFQSHYKLNKLAVYNGDFRFEDYSLSEKFSMALNPLTIIADSIDTSNKRVNISVKSGIKPFGDFSATISINPKDSGDFDLQYDIRKMPLAMFNPYTIAYTSFPLNRGTIEANGIWHVRNGIIKSDNHLLISNLRTNKRLKNKDANYIPVPLAMAFVRDANNLIDYEIPINGTLKNPKFKLKDILWDLVENIFVKPPTTPFRMKIKNIALEIENSFMLGWQMRKSVLVPDQEKFLEKLIDYLINNPEESIVVHPQWYAAREKEYILFFEARKKYFLYSSNKKEQSFNEQDSIQVDRMSVKDSLFVRYLNMQIKDPMLFTVHEKCNRLIGQDIVNSRFEQLKMEREENFLSYFKKKGVEKQIMITSGEDLHPYNGFSFFKIEYKSELPQSLVKAYRQMNEINEKKTGRK